MARKVLGTQRVHSKTLLEAGYRVNVVTEIPANGISRFLFCGPKGHLRWTPKIPWLLQDLSVVI